MKVIRLKPNMPVDTLPCAVALGFFDGMHPGHMALFQAVKQKAEEHGVAPCVVTFDDGSGGAKSSPKLTLEPQRFQLMEEAGMERIYVLSLGDVKEMPPRAFVKEILVGAIGAKVAVCGFNFRFGNNREGDGACLAKEMASFGGEAVVVPPVLYLGTPISATRIREAIGEGDMFLAKELWGRHFTLTAPVLHGKAIGRTLGVPTVNQEFPQNGVVPAFGVYASFVKVRGHRHIGVSNVGTRPTVGGDGINCETHILGFSGDVYEETVEVTFIYKLRGEQKFDSLEDLEAQIENDIGAVKKWQTQSGQN